MAQERIQATNQHLQHNSSSETEEEVRRRRRMAELEASREEQIDEGMPDTAPKTEQVRHPNLSE
jgi:hypothetical protein